MPVKVVTKYSGEITVGDGSSFYNDGYGLHVEDQELGVVASFAGGEWLYAWIVEETTKSDEAPEPRVLEKLRLKDLQGTRWLDGVGSTLSLEEPDVVRRTYASGDFYSARDPQWISNALGNYGPYTEVLDV